jgi:hypothetical protein
VTVANVNIDVNVWGPVLDGRARRIIDDFLDEAKWVVGSQGLANVQVILDRRIRFPTPYYETQVMVQRRADDVAVHDRGIIYGPWLEGVGSRNRTTRFKGYHSFRQATQELDKQVPRLVADAAARATRRLS